MSQDLREAVESAKAEHSELVARLAAHMRQHGFDQDDVDDRVIELACKFGTDAANRTDDEEEQEDAISLFEKEGSDLNNEGLETQIAALIVAYGERSTEHYVTSGDPDFDPSRQVLSIATIGP